MEGFDTNSFMMENNECELLANKRPTKVRWKEKGMRNIVDSLHLNCMVATYHHHFILYNWNQKYVTQPIFNQV